MTGMVMVSMAIEDTPMPFQEDQPDQKRIVAMLAAKCHMPVAEMAKL